MLTNFSMNSIKVFGSSHSVGHGLPDWSIDNMDKPSNYSWPAVLSKKIDVEVVNMAKCGNSLDEIFFEIESNINDISSNDLIIIQASAEIMWHTLYLYPSNEKIKVTGIDSVAHLSKKENQLFKEYNTRFCSDLYYSKNWIMKLYGLINLLEMNNKKYFLFLDKKPEFLSHSWKPSGFLYRDIERLFFKLINTRKLYNKFYTDYLLEIDKEYKMPCGHFNEKAHIVWADEIIKSF